MPNTSWKSWEREAAKALGGYRTGPQGYGLPDVSGIVLGLECKYQKRLKLRKEDILQAKRNAKDNPWALALKEKGGKYKLMIMDFDDFAKLFKDKMQECQQKQRSI